MQLFWRDPATREIIIRLGKDKGLPLFGSVLPFLGWKWVPSDARGGYVHCEDFSTPTHVRLVLGASWFGQGVYWYSYGDPKVRAVPQS